MRLANVGSADRILRLTLAAALAALPFLLPSLAPTSPLGIAAFAAALVLAVTALFRFCPIYGVFGLRTRPKG